MSGPARDPRHFGGDDRVYGGQLSRFAYVHGGAVDREKSSLRADHPALAEARTIFPSRVVNAGDADHLLISGHNNAKIGGAVVKGPWAGFPIYTLTLEERATCPTTCHLWRECYGNVMPLAKRHRYDTEFVAKLGPELRAKAAAHFRGFVVRLHVLGDFPDADYVQSWAGWLETIPRLRAFGYTAHAPDSPIGAEIALLNRRWPDRWAIRFSGTPDTVPAPMQVTTIWREARGEIDEGVVCPSSSGDTATCGTCGLCWAPAAADKRIVFIGHGMVRRQAADPVINEPEEKRVAPIRPGLPVALPARPIRVIVEHLEKELAWLRQAATGVEDLLAIYRARGGAE